jgi:hypothetical protein
MPAIIAIAAVVVFVGTAFPYLTSKNGSSVGWVPLSVGITLFALVVGWCTFSLGASPKGRWLRVSVSVIAAGIVFLLLFLFLVLNVVGS